MPELPEMENYRTLLSQTVLHKDIQHVEVRRERTINVPTDEFERRVLHRKIVEVRRRAKHILFYLDSDDALLLHLMLGGWMYYGSEEDIPEHSSQVVLTFEDGRMLYFQGLRLGYLHIHSKSELEAKMREFGPEPFSPELTPALFKQILKRKRGPIKFAMVNQHTIAGIGNCYSDEACFEAGILPLKHATDLSDAEFSTLYEGLYQVLTSSIRNGGYMEFPFFQGDTLTGGYNDKCLIYDRGGEPCLRCGHPIIKTDYNKRKVFYCEHCQH